MSLPTDVYYISNAQHSKYLTLKDGDIKAKTDVVTTADETNSKVRRRYILTWSTDEWVYVCCSGSYTGAQEASFTPSSITSIRASFVGRRPTSCTSEFNADR